MDALLMLATAAEGGEEEVSKTAFYVAGGIAAAFAVLVSIVGITRPTFPDGPGQQIAVTVVAMLVVTAAMAMTLITA